MNHTNGDKEEVYFPIKPFGDIYRGITLFERLRVHFNEHPIDSEKYVFVNQEDYEGMDQCLI